MMVRFFSHSTGSGNSAGEYLTQEYKRENSPPEVVSGDIDRTVDLINSIDRKHTHTSGVISFAKEDAPTRDQLLEVMKDFESHFFAGLDKDQYDITWVRHSHLGREELHFLTPRMELTTGKALNIAPPTESNKYKESFVKAWNYENGWADPGDPHRSREISQPVMRNGESHGYTLIKTREQIHDFVQNRILMGKVTDRASLVENLKSVGLTVNRQSLDYISVKTEDGSKVRLKGRVYKKDWTYDAELDRAHPSQNGTRPFRNAEDDRGRAERARGECCGYREQRANYNRARYKRPDETFDFATKVDLDYDSMLPDDHRRLFDLSLRPESVPRPGAPRPAERSERAESDTPGDRGFARGRSDPNRVRIYDSVLPERDRDAFVQPGRHTVHRVGEVDDVGSDTARAAALELAQAAARRARGIAEAADVSTTENGRATEGLRGAVSKCLEACEKAYKTVRELVRSMKTEASVPGRNLSADPPDLEPGS